ncbi:MAG: tRNA nucleotidyltransferase [Deltaproteobacteria bacterium CG12_big_fil_rev_8_21_14_0_65_43_10]|nr:MAG: tRNA nucleotidyltransferase [Deltaproteobacteria bacterium CG12_big_fil_rev_8_21_14_0_65_43_10]HCX90987.1 nucleotidyltransferase [Deltaproteobacteria bacterium]
MGIPESRLKTWSHQGAITTAKATHESIRNALDSYEWPDGINFEVYLQGSYKNDTNIRGDMDVDLVVQLNLSFYSNLSEEQKRYLELFPASYGWDDFRPNVLRALKDYYGSPMITEGNKSIKVKATGGRLPADVVVCAQYRKYRSLNGYDYVEGMTFWTRNESRQVINYPKIHYDNGIKKHQNTNNRYKSVVRMFKNIRNYIKENYYISNDLAPSYFLECLLYNVPNNKYSGSYQDVFCYIVNWLNNAKLEDFVCQNGQLKLFGNTPEQWSVYNAKTLIQKLVELWNNW